MRQQILHGHTIDAATTEELRSSLDTLVPPAMARIRANMSKVLDANGDGQDILYSVPVGFQFSLRRLFVNISTASSPVNGQVPLNVANRYVALLRSGSLIEYPVLVSPTGISQVPGIATWSNDEEPHIRNGEQLEIQVVGLTPNASVMCISEGKLLEDEWNVFPRPTNGQYLR